MPATYEPIATANGNGSSFTITFNSIPQTYTDLVLVAKADLNIDSGLTGLRFNGDTGSNYSYTLLESGPNSSRGTNAAYMFIGGLRNEYICHIQNYSNSTTNKTVLTRMGRTDVTGTGVWVGLWRNTAAITSLSFTTNQTSGYWNTSTIVTLYGIKAA